MVALRGGLDAEHLAGFGGLRALLVEADDQIHERAGEVKFAEMFLAKRDQLRLRKFQLQRAQQRCREHSVTDGVGAGGAGSV